MLIFSEHVFFPRAAAVPWLDKRVNDFRIGTVQWLDNHVNSCFYVLPQYNTLVGGLRQHHFSRHRSITQLLDDRGTCFVSPQHNVTVHFVARIRRFRYGALTAIYAQQASRHTIRSRPNIKCLREFNVECIISISPWGYPRAGKSHFKAH